MASSVHLQLTAVTEDLSFLDHMPNLKRLVVGSFRTAAEVVEYLSHPIEGRVNPCNMLEQLHLEGLWEQEVIEGLINRRWDAAKAVDKCRLEVTCDPPADYDE